MRDLKTAVARNCLLSFSNQLILEEVLMAFFKFFFMTLNIPLNIFYIYVGMSCMFVR